MPLLLLIFSYGRQKARTDFVLILGLGYGYALDTSEGPPNMDGCIRATTRGFFSLIIRGFTFTCHL
jgi:hypothetical protein